MGSLVSFVKSTTCILCIKSSYLFPSFSSFLNVLKLNHSRTRSWRLKRLRERKQKDMEIWSMDMALTEIETAIWKIDSEEMRRDFSVSVVTVIILVLSRNNFDNSIFFCLTFLDICSI